MRDEMTELNYRNEGVKLPKMTELNYRNDGVKLPRIVLRKSSGDPLDWKSFKETFEAAVHSSDSISNIEKFTYLKTYLDKSALQATARASPDKWKLHRGMATDRWKVRKWS